MSYKYSFRKLNSTLGAALASKNGNFLLFAQQPRLFLFFVTFGTMKHCFCFIRLYGVFPGLGRS